MTEYWRKIYHLNSKLNTFKSAISRHKEVVNRFMDSCERPYLSFSGGKDSSAMLCLFAEMGVTDIPVFTQGDDFDWEYKEQLCNNIISYLGFKNYSYIKSKVSVLELLKEDSENISMDDCWEDVVKGYVKENNRDSFCMGIRFEESMGRRFTLKKAYKEGLVRLCNDGLIHGYPVAFLKGVDIFSIILNTGIPYAEIYDKHDELAPHEMRFSWMFKPGISHSVGGLSWLRKHYPEQLRKLSDVNPLIHSMA